MMERLLVTCPTATTEIVIVNTREAKKATHKLFKLILAAPAMLEHVSPALTRCHALQ